jgi:hypothetical protein
MSAGNTPLFLEPQGPRREDADYDPDDYTDAEDVVAPEGLQPDGSTITYLRRPDGEPYAIRYTYPDGDDHVIPL